MTLPPTETTDIDEFWKIHQYVNRLPRVRPEDIETITISKGIYFLFEEGETYMDFDRIVFIGSGPNSVSLSSRISEVLFSREKPSQFRINLRSAFPSSLSDEQADEHVDEYIKTHMSIACVEINNIIQRSEMRRMLVILLQNDGAYQPSPTWIGRNSTNRYIFRTGIWQNETGARSSVRNTDVAIFLSLCNSSTPEEPQEPEEEEPIDPNDQVCPETGARPRARRRKVKLAMFGTFDQ